MPLLILRSKSNRHRLKRANDDTIQQDKPPLTVPSNAHALPQTLTASDIGASVLATASVQSKDQWQKSRTGRPLERTDLLICTGLNSACTLWPVLFSLCRSLLSVQSTTICRPVSPRWPETMAQLGRKGNWRSSLQWPFVDRTDRNGSLLPVPVSGGVIAEGI